MKLKYILPLAVIVISGVSSLLGQASKAKPAAAVAADPTQVQRGKYLVAFGGCSDCHTPLKSGPHGPEPDLARFLSGHPEDTQLPPADLKPGPWFAATAGMTAWAGPWGITYAPNLTPDPNTGLGIWTEDMFISAMRTGKHMGSGRPIRPPMPWQNLAALNDADLKAIFAYLRTLPHTSNHVPPAVDPSGVAAE